MKKFTFIFTLFLITLFASAQNKNDLQFKIQRSLEKSPKIAKENVLLSKLIEKQSLNPKSFLKSVTATQKLDSMVNRVLNQETQAWQNDYKDEFLYDSEMKNTFWIEKQWNVLSSTYELSYKSELGYDNKDRINSMLVYSRDSLTQPITLISKLLVFYNSDGTQDSMLNYITENAGISWVLFGKHVYKYNASKQLIKTEMWALDEDEGSFVLSSNIVYTYTAAGKIKTESTNILMEGDEFLWAKVENNYDGSGKLTSTVNSSLNMETFSLRDDSRNTYQYNASGYVSVDTYSTWNGTSWINEEKIEYAYNPAGDVSVEIYSTWNGTAWVEEDKDEYTYSSTSFSEIVFPYFSFLYGLENEEELSYSKVITGVNSYEMLNGSWRNTEKTSFYYSAGTSTNINEIENSVISVYPNPASESINFSWKGNNEALSLQIYQITGAKVTEQTVYSGRPVSISHLENGVYLYKLLNGQQNVKTGKLIKR
jgi:hypothetical protein